MNTFKKSISLGGAILVGLLRLLPVAAQSPATLSLNDCYEKARQHYPLTRQSDLIAKSGEYTLANISTGYWPQVSLAGQATYQSDVTRVPISIPGMNIPTAAKDQYKIYGEVVQPITDILTVNEQKKLSVLNTATEQQKLEVELFKLRERINNIYFGIMYIDAQLGQITLLQNDLQTALKKAKAASANGIGFRINEDVIQVELLKSKQKVTELNNARQGFVNMLGLFVNETLPADLRLAQPVGTSNLDASAELKRPELVLFERQSNSLASQGRLAKIKTYPRFSLFGQAGYGRPALNMLVNDFDFYYIGGLRMQWNLSSFYTQSKEQKLINLQKESIEQQRQAFTLNSKLQLSQQEAEIKKWQQLLIEDEDIIKLREQIKTTATAQLENGVITANDYLTYLNAADQARQNKIIHQAQLLMAQYALLNTLGQ